MKYKGKNISKPQYYIYTSLSDKYFYLYETNYLSKHIYENVLKNNINKNNIQNIYEIDEYYTYSSSNIDYNEDISKTKKRKRNEEKKKIEFVINRIKKELDIENKIKYTFLENKKIIKIKLSELCEENKIIFNGIMEKLENKNLFKYEKAINKIFTKCDEIFKNKIIARAEKKLEKDKQGIKLTNYVVNKYVDYDTDDILTSNGYGSDGYCISDCDSDTKIKYYWSLSGIYNSREDYYY